MIKKNTDGNSSPESRRGAHAAPSAGDSRREAARQAKAEQQAARQAEKEARQAEKAQQQAEQAAQRAAKKEERAIRAAEAKSARKGTVKKLKIVGIVVAVLLVLLVGGAAAWGYSITNSAVNLPRVYVDGISVGGMTREQTLAALDEHKWDEAVSDPLVVTLPTDVRFEVDMCLSGAMLTKEGAANAAYSYGHTGNWFGNLFTYLENLISPVDVISGDLRLDEAYIRQCAQAGVDAFAAKNAGGGYELDMEKAELRMVKGAGQMEISLDNLCGEVSLALLGGSRQLDYTRIDSNVPMPDFSAIHTALAVEPQDAHFAEGSYEVVDEVVGCSFDPEQAKSLWSAAQPGEIIHIPLTITQPEITAEYLRSVLFRDLLGAQTTKFSGSTANRINNIELAAGSLNGVILLPGEVFSYNDTVGQRTVENGYKAADAYNDGQVVQEIGGGICQVSSTLYCATMYAQMETVERTNHYFKVGYLGYSMDATVSWGGPDFKFRNGRDFPVKIVTYCNEEERTLTIEIWGTDVDGSYVELRAATGAIYDSKYTDVLIGYGSQCTRVVYDKDGNWLRDIREPYGVYHLHDEDIKWPEDKDKDDDYAEPSPSPSPSPTPTPPPATEAPTPPPATEAPTPPPATEAPTPPPATEPPDQGGGDSGGEGDGGIVVEPDEYA